MTTRTGKCGRSRCDIERRVGREILSSCCFAEKGRYGIDRDVGLRRSRDHYRKRTTNEACVVDPRSICTPQPQARDHPISFLADFFALRRSFSPLFLAFSALSKPFTLSFCPTLVSPTITLRPAVTIVWCIVERAVERFELAVRVVWDDMRSEGGDGR